MKKAPRLKFFKEPINVYRYLLLVEVYMIYSTRYPLIIHLRTSLPKGAASVPLMLPTPFHIELLEGQRINLADVRATKIYIHGISLYYKEMLLFYCYVLGYPLSRTRGEFK